MKQVQPDRHAEDVESREVDEAKINELANIAVIGSEINIRVRAKDPMDYLTRYRITEEKLHQQFVPTDREIFRVDRYETFLTDRAKTLAREAERYLDRLRKALQT